MTQEDKLNILKEKTKDNLLKACEKLYECELALCEMYVPEEWKKERKEAWEEWVWKYQDYEIVKDAISYNDIKDEELNYDYVL